MVLDIVHFGVFDLLQTHTFWNWQQNMAMSAWIKPLLLTSNGSHRIIVAIFEFPSILYLLA